MASDDMNHMIHIESVALSDCAVLESKEATYQGSWKRAGGRSAWFMARRNMDRMITMAAPPKDECVIMIDDIDKKLKESDGEDSDVTILHQSLKYLRDCMLAEDIFKLIAANPKGEDGTFLACMRDARRYFTLVEAEMIAEQIVEVESKTYEGDEYPMDVYGLIANDIGVDREEVKRRINDLFYGPDAGARRAAEIAAAPVPVPEAGPMVGGAFTEKDVVFPGAREISPNFHKVYDEGVVYQEGMPKRPPTIEELAEMGRKDATVEEIAAAMPRPSPEDGSHHASLTPWEIGPGYHATLVARVGLALVDQFFSRRTPEVWRLEPVVQGERILREIKDCYDFLSIVEEGPLYLLKRKCAPEEIREQWPRLQQEMNEFEFGQSPKEFRFMYWPQGEKIVLRPAYSADWAREA